MLSTCINKGAEIRKFLMVAEVACNLFRGNFYQILTKKKKTSYEEINKNYQAVA